MTEKERQELHNEIAEAVAAAVSDALGDHQPYCRFSEQEAKLVHQLPEDVDRNALIALGRMAKAWDAASVWIGRVLLLALLTLLVWGLSKLDIGGIQP